MTMTKEESLFKSAARGALIGFLGGMFTPVAMLVFLGVYSAAQPASHIEAPLTIVLCGLCSMTFGYVLGAIGGVVAGLTGFLVKGPLRCSLFGGMVLGTIGLLELLADLYKNPDDFSRAPMLSIGLFVFSGVLAGASSGAINGIFFRRPRPNPDGR